MKKFALAVMGILLCMLLLGGCDMLRPGQTGEGGAEPSETEKTAAEIVLEKYGRIAEAEQVERTVEIVHGTLMQYKSERTYRKTGEKYEVRGKITRLNDLTAETAYTEEEISEEAEAGKFEPKLNLDELYFREMTYEAGRLEAKVRANGAEGVLGLRAGALKTPVEDMVLTFETDETHVTSLTIRYTSEGSAVEIALRFAYKA